MRSGLALCATVAVATGAYAQTYEVTKLVPGSAFHGVHGLGIDKAGRLFAGSVAGAVLYEVDQASWRCPAASASPPTTAKTPSMSPTCSPIALSMGHPASSPSRPAKRDLQGDEEVAAPSVRF
jgi:hypothetical protein